MWKRWICGVAAWLSCVAIGMPAADAHDLPLDRVMNGFIKIGEQQADFVVRVPLDLLIGVPFPVAGDRYDIASSGPAVQGALGILTAYLAVWEGDTRLTPSGAHGALSPVSDLSFENYESAVAHAEQAPAPDTVIAYQMGYLDAHFVYPITSPNSVFAIEDTLAADLGDYTKLAIRFTPPGEAGRALMLTGASGRVLLNPPWYEASAGFIRLGVEHILTGFDHILFLLCLIIPFRRISGLIPVITAFTVGHSITLIGTAFGLAPAGRWFPPLVETGIAVSIVYMAIENAIDISLRRRWIVAGLFGLVHGFGFADILSDRLQFAGSNLLAALLSFNVGIELGQLAILCAFVPVLSLLMRGAMSGRIGIIVVSVIIGHTAWHWMIDRAQALWATPWPLPTSEGLMALARWIAALVIAVIAARVLSIWLDHRWPARVAAAKATLRSPR